MRYLIIAQTANRCILVEFQNDRETAIERSNLYYELAFNPPVDEEELNQTFKEIVSFKIYNEFVEFSNSIAGSTNGIDSTDVIPIENEFNFREFVIQRECGQYAFKSIELDRYFNLSEKLNFSYKHFQWVN